MTTVFADSYYYLALANSLDQGHAKALRFGDTFRGQIITTEWILTEIGDAFSQSPDRAIFLEILATIENDPRTMVVEATHDLFLRGVQLFRDRSDKDWSLTDCISFVVMEEHAVRDSLTADHHFEQAGFVALLA